MIYDKWALTRVDELERRVAALSSKKTYTKAFEVSRTHENEYYSGQQVQILLGQCVARAGEPVSFSLRVWGEFLFEEEADVSLVLNNETIFSFKAKEKEEFVWQISNTTNVFETCQNSLSLLVCGESLHMIVQGFVLQAFGEFEEVPIDSKGAILCADIWDASAKGEDEGPKEEEKEPNAKEESHLKANTLAMALAGSSLTSAQIAAYRRILSGEVDSSALVVLGTVQEQAQTTQNSPLVLKNGQKFAISKVEEGFLFVAEFEGEGTSVTNPEFKKICKADDARIAYDKLGNLRLAKVVGGTLFVSNENQIGAWNEIETGVLGFDIVSAPQGSKATLLVVYSKDGTLFLAETEKDNLQKIVAISTQKPAKNANFARKGENQRQIFVVCTDGSVWVIDIVPEPEEMPEPSALLAASCSVGAH